MNLTDKARGLTLGAQFLEIEKVDPSELGALAPLVGKWTNAPVPEQAISSGWNVISVPGVDKGFVYEVIPYTEVLNFSAVAVQAGNRGPVINGKQVEQIIFGLLYEQQITSVCTSAFCEERGFKSGVTIHAETGLFLNLGQPNGGYSLARMSTIPHGNSLLALGSSFDKDTPGTDFFAKASAVPTLLNGDRVSGFGYSDQIIGNPQFSVFDQINPNTFLKQTLDALTDNNPTNLKSMSVLELSTDTPNADGGILNIPFIQTNVNATKLDSTFWIEDLANGQQVLQYSQTINLVFPATGSPIPINWPHITINTLVRS